MEPENTNSQPTPVQPTMAPTQEPGAKKGASLSLFIFAVIVLLVIALLWKNSQNSYEQEQLLPAQETVAPQTNQEMSTELTTIEAELGELDSQAVAQAL